MENNNNTCNCGCGHFKMINHFSKKTSGNIYSLAFIGAAFYYIQHATTFWIGVLGVLKAAIWPAMLMYKLLSFWGM